MTPLDVFLQDQTGILCLIPITNQEARHVVAIKCIKNYANIAVLVVNDDKSILLYHRVLSGNVVEELKWPSKHPMDVNACIDKLDVMNKDSRIFVVGAGNFIYRYKIGTRRRYITHFIGPSRSTLASRIFRV